MMINKISGYLQQGLPGKALFANSVNNEYVKCNNYRLFHSGNVYFVFWIRRNPSDVGGSFIASSMATSSARAYWYFQFNTVPGTPNVTSILFSYQFVLSGSVTTVELATKPDQNTDGTAADVWQLICIGTSGSGAVTVSINGQTYETITTSSNAGTSLSANTVFGGRPPLSATSRIAKEATSNFFNGYYDDFHVFNAQPTLDYLGYIYNGKKGRKPHKHPQYKANCVSHVAMDNQNAVDCVNANQGWAIMSNIYHDEYIKTGVVYMDGVNDTVRGLNGSSGFNLTRLRSSNAVTLNILINFINPLDNTDPAAYVITGTGGSNYYVRYALCDATPSNLSNNEIATFGGHTSNTYTWFASSMTFTGWMMLTYSNGTFYVNGVSVGVKGGDTIPGMGWGSVSSLYIGSFGSTGFWEHEWRELSIWNGKYLTAQDILDLYNYYTTNGTVSLGNSSMKLKNNSTLIADANLTENWSGDIINSEVVASKRPKTLNAADHHNLTISGRVMTPTMNTSFARRRGTNLI